jgi:hypothetical protein
MSENSEEDQFPGVENAIDPNILKMLEAQTARLSATVDPAAQTVHEQAVPDFADKYVLTPNSDGKIVSTDIPDHFYPTPRSEIVEHLDAADEAAEQNKPFLTYEEQLTPAEEIERKMARLRKNGVELSNETLMRAEEEASELINRQSRSNKPSRHYDGSKRESARVGAYRRMDDTALLHAKADAAVAGHNYRFELRGHANATNAPYDADRKVIIDQIAQWGATIGMTPFYGPLVTEDDTVAQSKKRWTTKRVNQADILGTLRARGCMTAQELSDALYTEEWWTDADRGYGAKKMRVALMTSVTSGTVTRHKADDGRSIYALKDQYEDGMALRKRFNERLLAGEVSTNPALELMTNDPPIEATAAAAAKLKEFFEPVFPNRSDDVWRDFARDVIKAAWRGMIKGPEERR